MGIELLLKSKLRTHKTELRISVHTNQFSSPEASFPPSQDFKEGEFAEHDLFPFPARGQTAPLWSDEIINYTPQGTAFDPG